MKTKMEKAINLMEISREEVFKLILDGTVDFDTFDDWIDNQRDDARQDGYDSGYDNGYESAQDTYGDGRSS